MRELVLSILIVATLSGCGGKSDKYEFDLPLRPVSYEIVKETNNIVQRGYSGAIKSEALSNLSFRVSGTMVERNVDIGDSIKAGEVLATIDPTEYEVKFQQSVANLERGKAILADAKANYERNQILYLENSISKAQYQSSLANYESSLSNVRALESQVEYAHIQLSYTKLIAPTDGTIGSVKTEINQSVTPQTVIFTLNSAGAQYVEFNVSESTIPLLSIGQDVSIVIESLNGLKLNGKIKNIGTVSAGFGNTYPIKVEISDPNGEMRVGMNATVYLNIKVGQLQDKIVVVPLESISKDPDGKTYVYIIKDIKDGTGIVEKRYVTTGIVSNLGMEILSGLNQGDYIVTMGVSRLQSGEKVGVPSKGEN